MFPSKLFYQIPGLESPKAKHSPHLPSKTIKSILKKNKNYTADNNYHDSILRQTVHNASQDIGTNAKQKMGKDGLPQKSTSQNQHMANGHVKKVHLNSNHDVCNNDSNAEKEHEQFNSALQNGIASKASEHLHTVQVDIH